MRSEMSFSEVFFLCFILALICTPIFIFFRSHLLEQGMLYNFDTNPQLYCTNRYETRPVSDISVRCLPYFNID